MTRKRNNNRDNNVARMALRQWYEHLAMSMYDWQGLPDNIYSFYPEQTLYRNGMAVMIQLPASDLYDIFPVAYGSLELDLHGLPLSWRCYVMGSNPVADMIRNTVYDAESSVLIWNNPERNGCAPYVDDCIDRMLYTDNALMTNIMVQNTPVWVKADAKNALNAKALFTQFNLEPAIFSTDAIKDDTSLEVIDLGVDFIGDKLSDQYETFNDRILKYLGVGHLPVEKQERMLTGEVDADDDLMELAVQQRLKCRQQAAENMKEVFGLEVEVDIYEPEPDPSMEGVQSAFQLGGADRDA